VAKTQLEPVELKIKKLLDQDKETSRSFRKFKHSIKSDHTYRAYNIALDKFMVQSKLASYDKAIKLKTDRIQDLLEDFVISNKKYSFQTGNQYLSAVELFFDMNMILYHKRVLRKLLPGNDVEPGGKLPYTTEEIHRILSVSTKLRTKALIHYLASTGSRPAGIEDPVLRLKHVEEMPHGCKSIYIYDGSKEGYFTFLTPEASKALDNYFRQRKINGEILTDESPVFVNMSKYKSSKYEHFTKDSVRQMTRDLLIKAGIERIKKGKRYDKAAIYGFRKRFNTILKLNNDVNSNIAEKLMAHKRGLDGTYLQPTKEECFAEFVKAIPFLTVSDDERIKLENEKLKEEKSELEKANEDKSILLENYKKLEARTKRLESIAKE